MVFTESNLNENCKLRNIFTISATNPKYDLCLLINTIVRMTRFNEIVKGMTTNLIATSPIKMFNSF